LIILILLLLFFDFINQNFVDLLLRDHVLIKITQNISTTYFFGN